MNREDFFRIGRNRVRTQPATSLDAKAIDTPGNAIHVVALAASAMAEEVESRSVARAGALLGATAIDEDLDRWNLEKSHQRLPRQGASAAVLSLQISRSAPGAVGGFLEPGTRLIAGSVAFTLDAPGVSFPANEIGPVSASATCATLGTAGNVLASELRGFEKPSLLFDSTLSVVAVGDAAGGAEREQDSAYRARFAEWDAGLDRNMRLIVAAAFSAGGVSYAVAIEDINPQSGLATGSVSLYVADANGRANEALLQRVRLAIANARLPGQRVTLYGAAPIFQALVLRVAVKSGFDIALVQSSVRGAVVARQNATPPGAGFQRELIANAILTVPGAAIDPAYPTGVITPPANIAAASTATIFRTSADLVSFA